MIEPDTTGGDGGGGDGVSLQSLHVNGQEAWMKASVSQSPRDLSSSQFAEALSLTSQGPEPELFFFLKKREKTSKKNKKSASIRVLCNSK